MAHSEFGHYAEGLGVAFIAVVDGMFSLDQIIQFLLDGVAVRRMAEVVHQCSSFHYVGVDATQPPRVPQALFIGGKPLRYSATYLSHLVGVREPVVEDYALGWRHHLGNVTKSS